VQRCARRLPIVEAVIDLDALAQTAAALEPLPTSVIRLAGLVAHGTPDVGDVVDVVQYDPALTAVLLRSANSSWSASRVEIATVKDAVVRLGAGHVLSVALGVNVRDRIDTAVPEYDLSEHDLWEHSVAASLAAEAFMRVVTPRPPVETPTAALLHDVGKLVMSRYLDAEDLRVIGMARDSGITRITVERETLGVDHAELGGLIAQAWDLPETLRVGIGYHHAPEDVDAPVAYAVHLADAAATRVGHGVDDNADLETFARAMGELGLTADAYDDVCAQVADRFDEVIGRFG
jgi:HD-like signal output (HDOD) protein